MLGAENFPRLISFDARETNRTIPADWRQLAFQNKEIQESRIPGKEFREQWRLSVFRECAVSEKLPLIKARFHRGVTNERDVPSRLSILANLQRISTIVSRERTRGIFPKLAATANAIARLDVNPERREDGQI